MARPTRDVTIRDSRDPRRLGRDHLRQARPQGGFHDIKVSGPTVHHPTRVGILFKSAHHARRDDSGTSTSPAWTCRTSSPSSA
ncbi:hypothetical protein ACRAWD_29535 [Caulobacter segnis]